MIPTWTAGRPARGDGIAHPHAIGSTVLYRLIMNREDHASTLPKRYNLGTNYTLFACMFTNRSPPEFCRGAILSQATARISQQWASPRRPRHPVVRDRRRAKALPIRKARTFSQPDLSRSIKGKRYWQLGQGPAMAEGAST
jgi:hypothetical protein